MKRSLKLCLALVLMSCFNWVNAQSTCIVADYPLNGDAGDVGKNSFHGNLNGTTPTTDRFGRPNHALKFNGTSDYVDLGTDADFEKRSISVWFKAEDFPSNMGSIFTSDHGNMTYANLGLNVDNPGSGNRINFGVGSNVRRYTSALTNTWYHYVLTVDPSFIRFFINGQLFDSMPNNNTLHSSDGVMHARLGCTRITDRFFKGSIDDVKIYDCALSRDQIQNLYNYSPNTHCLVAHYPLDGDAKDIGKNKLTGTLHGTTPEKDRLGNPNSALRFNGTSDYVQLGTDADFAEKSLVVWFKADDFPSNMGSIFSSDNPNLNYGAIGLNVDNPGSANRINFGVGANVGRYTTAQKDVWYNYVLTVDAKHIRFYINGQLFDSMSNNSTLHSSDGDYVARLGCTRKTDRFFKGVIDDVKIYDCVLSRADIVNNFTASVKEVEQHSLKIYPNPAENTLQIVNDGSSATTRVSVVDATGKLVLEKADYAYGDPIHVDFLAKGIYFIQLVDEGKQVVLKFIKE